MTDILAAEWLKARTVASSFYCVGLAVAGVVLSTLLTFGMVSAYDGLPRAERATFSGTPMEEVTMLVAHLCLGLFGVLTVSSEYSTGMIRATLIAMPGRRTVLVAKAVIVAAVAFTVGQAVIFASFFLSRAVVGNRPIPEYTSAVGHETSRLFAMGLTVLVVAMVGFGLGAVLRSATGAIAGLVLLVYVFPIAAGNIPAPLGPKVDALSLRNLAFQLAGTKVDPVLSPGAALAVMAAYVAVAVGAGVFLIGRRDA
jgi:ABC-2 type transport system permease protein